MNKKIILPILFIFIVGVLFSFSVQEALSVTDTFEATDSSKSIYTAADCDAGECTSASVSWNAVHDRTTGKLSSTSRVYLATCLSSGKYTIALHRVVVYFDTSSLPDDANISSAILKLYGKDSPRAEFGSWNLQIQKGTSATYPHDPPQESDFYYARYTDNGGTLSSSLMGTGYKSISFNSSWINKTGTTKFVLREKEHDINDSRPGYYSSPYYNMWTFYTASASYPALLEVDYTLPVSPPTVTTDIATISSTQLQNDQATLKGNVTDTGGENPSQRVLEWGTSSGNYTNSYDLGSGGTGEFTYTISLTPGTIYYYRAKAYNSAGWGYGSEKRVVIYQDSGGQQSFTTPSAEEPTISFSPPSFTFSATEGGSNPSSQTLEVWNSGSGTLSWSVSDDATWLTLSPASGSSTGEHDSVTLSVNISGMTAGAYNGTITISASGATNTPQTLTVTLTIGSGCVRAIPSVNLSPDSQDGNPNVERLYSIRVTNNDSDPCGVSTFTLSKSCPSGWTCVLDDTSLIVSPEDSLGKGSSLSVTPPSGEELGSYPISVTALNQTAQNNGEGTYSNSDSASYNITGCTGNIALTLIPPIVAPLGSVTPSASGLSNSGCEGKTISFKSGSCSGSQVSFCTIPTGGSGCTGSNFSAPNTTGQYIYFACVDKNGDEDYLDTGEQDSATLNVTSASCTEGGICANPGEVCCVNDKLYTCQQSNPTAVFYSTPSDGYLWAISSIDYAYVHHMYPGNVDDTWGNIYVGQSGNGSFTVYRGALFFDTSSLPGDANITAATVSLFGSANNSNTDFNVILVNGAELDDPLVGEDFYPDLYDATESRGFFSTLNFKYSYNDIPLNNIGISEISQASTTKFGIRSSRDINYIEPWQTENVAFYSNEAGGNLKPKLSVTYTSTPVWQYTQDCSYGCCDASDNPCDPCLPPISCQCCPAIYTLTVSKSGTGSGEVNFNPPDTDFSLPHEETYTASTSVILTAKPDIGSTFAGWSGGGCSGTSTCTAIMYADKSVTATFNLSDTTSPTTMIKIIRTSIGEDVTAAEAWLRADTYTIEFEDNDPPPDPSGLQYCEYYIYACDIGGTPCTIEIVPLTTRNCNWSTTIDIGTFPYDLEGLLRYRIYSGATDNANNSGTDYKYLNTDFKPPETKIE